MVWALNELHKLGADLSKLDFPPFLDPDTKLFLIDLVDMMLKHQSIIGESNKYRERLKREQATVWNKKLSL